MCADFVENNSITGVFHKDCAVVTRYINASHAFEWPVQSVIIKPFIVFIFVENLQFFVKRGLNFWREFL